VNFGYLATLMTCDVFHDGRVYSEFGDCLSPLTVILTSVVEQVIVFGRGDF